MSDTLTAAQDLAQSVWLNVIIVGCLLVIAGTLLADRRDRRRERSYEPRNVINFSGDPEQIRTTLRKAAAEVRKARRQ